MLSEEKLFFLNDLSKNEEINRHFEHFINDVTGTLGSSPFYTVATINVKDLEKLIYRSFLEGALSKELEIKKQLELVYE